MSSVLRFVGFLALTGVTAMLVFGCAESRPPINRVQANALDKSFFVGPNLSDPSDDPEFYFGTRIIDEPYGLGQGFWMFQSIGSLARIKWDIEETLLIARLTYERISNSDYHGSQTSNSGQIVAEFTIQSHFDIKNDYNTQTGEQLNVIVENTTDRPWYERQYFRVDWSKNLVTDAYDFDLFALGSAIDGLKYDPGSYYVQDPSDPNAPVFEQLDRRRNMFGPHHVDERDVGGDDRLLPRRRHDEHVREAAGHHAVQRGDPGRPLVGHAHASPTDDVMGSPPGEGRDLRLPGEAAVAVVDRGALDGERRGPVILVDVLGVLPDEGVSGTARR